MSYLRSYEGMGVARISCAAGCECEPVLADAHVPTEHVSVRESVAFNVTQSPDCELLVEVAPPPEARGGDGAAGRAGQAGAGARGNKWKLLGLDVRATEPTALARGDADADAAGGVGGA